MKFDFDDINLVPKKCVVNSRSECDTSVRLGKHTFKLPIVPANMECVIDINIAKSLSSLGYFYILHRFYLENTVLEFLKDMNQSNLITSISIGVNDDSYLLIQKIIDERIQIDYITVDIAHGHSVKMEKMLKHLKEVLPETFIIAGNVSSSESIFDLENWGADAIKVGIGPGSACTTFPSTGFGSRNCQASTIYHCANVSNLPIIADGGIKNPGDIAKALVLGATIVMVGGMMSGYLDSPGNVIEKNGIEYKEFWGSASVYQSGKSNRIEGKKTLVEFKNESILDGLTHIQECLQSSISYAGGNSLESFDSVKWI